MSHYRGKVMIVEDFGQERVDPEGGIGLTSAIKVRR